MQKTPEEVAIEVGQDCLKASPVIVLGSGASVPAGIPSMADLATHLIEFKPHESLSGHDHESWHKFVSRLQSQDLESALASSPISESLSDLVIEQTWTLIKDADVEVFNTLIANRSLLPLARLYSHLFKSTHRTVTVVTTNYDRLAEYAADVAGYCHYTGFTYGYFRRRQAMQSRISFTQSKRRAQTVDIWKVHGCLDWFIDNSEQVVGVASAKSVPAGCRPAIVTPGVSKYAQTHQEPFRSVISGADNALMDAKAYLCIGFGFNDAHIQPKLMERWQQGDALLVILTKSLSESARAMLDSANGQKFLVLEEAENRNGTLVRSNHCPTGQVLDGIDLWQLATFLDQTT